VLTASVSGTQTCGMRQLPRAGAVLLLSLFCTALTTERIPDLAALSHSASAICVARVASQQSRWDAHNKLIVTDTTLTVTRWLKGGTGTTTVVTEVGGSVDGTTLHNPARAVFTVGGSYLVFLTSRATGGQRTLWGPYGRVVTSDSALQGWEVQHPGAATLPVVLDHIRAAVGGQP